MAEKKVEMIVLQQDNEALNSDLQQLYQAVRPIIKHVAGEKITMMNIMTKIPLLIRELQSNEEIMNRLGGLAPVIERLDQRYGEQ